MPACERLNVRLTWGIHSPLPVRPGAAFVRGDESGAKVFGILELIQRTGTDKLGFVPDMGLFTKGPYLDAVEALIRTAVDGTLQAELRAIYAETGLYGFAGVVEEQYGDWLPPDAFRALRGKNSDPKDLELIMPYITGIQGTVRRMAEIPGQPGEYDDPSTMNAEVIEVLERNCWDGYFHTELAGQGRNLPRDRLADEVEQVRRHQNMLRRLTGA